MKFSSVDTECWLVLKLMQCVNNDELLESVFTVNL